MVSAETDPGKDGLGYDYDESALPHMDIHEKITLNLKKATRVSISFKYLISY